MLSQLLIKNFALIEKLEISPDSQLNIITGETGAGKSIILGALGLLLGQRGDGRVVAGNQEKCVIEGVFQIKDLHLQSFFEENDLEYDDETVIRREVALSGKSRLFINDVPSTLDIAKQLGNYLIDIHSQHDTLKLGTQQYQLELLDAFAQNSLLLNEYKAAYKEYRSAEEAFSELKEKSAALQKEYAFNKFQLDELEKAQLKEGEMEEMEAELSILDNSEEIISKASEAFNALSGGEVSATVLMAQASGAVRKLASYSHTYAELETRLDSAIIELNDISSELEQLLQEVETNPDRQDELNTRIMFLNGLFKKHNSNTISELLAVQNSLRQSVNQVENLDELLTDAQNKVSEKQALLELISQRLSESRKLASINFEALISPLFATVGMPNARLEIQMQRINFSSVGADEVNWLFSANKGVTSRELKQVASGGEFSRLMLLIKYLMAEKTALPTIVFDEIDSGISGEVARQVGKLIAEMAGKHQVFAITHLPQLASQGNRHYFVYKDNSGERTISKLRELNKEERIEELAQMISGTPVSETALAAAKEMLA